MPAASSSIDSQATDARGFLIPPVRSFSALYNVFSRTYSYRWDEAVRAGRQNAQAMRRDAYLAALEQERVVPLTRWKHAIAVDPDEADLANPKDPRSADREHVRRLLQTICNRTPDLHHLKAWLGSAVFFGRAGVQLVWARQPVVGDPLWAVKAWEPVHGDCIQYTWDGVPGISIRPGEVGTFPKEDLKTWDGGTTLALLRRTHFRQRFILHAHKREAADYWQPEMAGRNQGVGLRDYVYWAWWLRDEMTSWLMDYMEKVGSMGLLLFYYEEGNPAAEAAAQQAAADARGKNALAVPVPRGRDKASAKVEVIAAQTGGAQFLVDMVDRYFEKHIERLYVGQSLSAGTAGGGLGGSGVAALHEDTKFNLLAWDAENLGATLTRDLVAVVQDLNFRGVPWRYRWAFALPDPGAADKLAALAKAASLPGAKLAYKADEVRALVGLTKPGPGDEIVGGDEPQPGAGGPQSGSDGERPVGYAREAPPHAPVGGAHVQGKHFLGGQFVPHGAAATVPVAAPVGQGANEGRGTSPEFNPVPGTKFTWDQLIDALAKKGRDDIITYLYFRAGRVTATTFKPFKIWRLNPGGDNLDIKMDKDTLHLNFWNRLSADEAAQELSNALDWFGDGVADDFRHFWVQHEAQSESVDDFINRKLEGGGFSSGSSLEEKNKEWARNALKAAPAIMVGAAIRLMLDLAPGAPGTKLLGALIARGWRLGKNAASKLVFQRAGQELTEHELSTIASEVAKKTIVLEVVAEYGSGLFGVIP